MTQVPSPEQVYQLSILIQTGLVDWQDYYPWADALVEALGQPPLWLLELSVEKDSSAAVRLLREQVLLPQEKELTHFNFKDFFAASYFVKVSEGSLSWNDFLLQAGICADGPEATIPVYDFYDALQTYVNSGQSEKTKAQQMDWVEQTLAPAIALVKETLGQLRQAKI